MAAKSGECVKVVVRCRPLNSREQAHGSQQIIHMNSKQQSVYLEKPDDVSGRASKTFTFDQVYDPNCTQAQVYEETARPIVESVMNGYNGTIFAYGQTGTGKTFTMEGLIGDEHMRGIMPNAFYNIFETVNQASNNCHFAVKVSMLEIYQDNVYDLLNTEKLRKPMEVRESKKDGVFVPGLTERKAMGVDDLVAALLTGQKARATGATAMNQSSSRSHSILTVNVARLETDESGTQHWRSGKLNLVDLAGSERQKKTKAVGERLDEAKAINLSLTALGNVIKALVNVKATHVPFRDSKLTRLLQDSLGGNTKTLMIANVGPADYNYDETISTLRYADRAKKIKNKPTINEDPKDAKLRELQERIQLLNDQMRSKYGVELDPLSLGLGSGDVDTAEIERRIVKKVVQSGISEEELKAERQRSEEEQERLRLMTEQQRQEELIRQKEASEKKRVYEQELENKSKMLAQEHEVVQQLASELQQMQAMFVEGGQQIDKAMRKKQELEMTERALAEQRAAEEELRRKMEDAEEEELFLNQQYHSRQEEIAKKTKILKTLFTRYQQKKAELDDLQEEWELDQENLIDAIRDLWRQISLRNVILDQFVPPNYVELIQSRAQYDEYNDTYIIPGFAYAANNIARPESRGLPVPAAAGTVGFGVPGHNMFGVGSPKASGAVFRDYTPEAAKYANKRKKKRRAASPK
jgi:Kinesin motor domain